MPNEVPVAAGSAGFGGYAALGNFDAGVGGFDGRDERDDNMGRGSLEMLGGSPAFGQPQFGQPPFNGEQYPAFIDEQTPTGVPQRAQFDGTDPRGR
jgi:hypothetical protein